MKRSLSKSGSFSLVEVVLALGLVGFAVIVVLAFFPAGLASNRSSAQDTRAAQIARAIFGTIDSQCATFNKVICYPTNPADSTTGLILDLSLLKTTNDDPADQTNGPKMLYAAFASPDQPTITKTQTTDSIYTIELRFDNAPSTVAVNAGTVNQIELRVYGRSKTDGVIEFFYLARNKG